MIHLLQRLKGGPSEDHCWRCRLVPLVNGNTLQCSQLSHSYLLAHIQRPSIQTITNKGFLRYKWDCTVQSSFYFTTGCSVFIYTSSLSRAQLDMKKTLSPETCLNSMKIVFSILCCWNLKLRKPKHFLSGKQRGKCNPKQSFTTTWNFQKHHEAEP